MELSEEQKKAVVKLINKRSVKDKALKCIEIILGNDKKTTHGEMLAIGVMLMNAAKKEMEKEGKK